MSGDPVVGAGKARAKITAPAVVDMKRRGELITVVTAYDFPTARLAEQAGVEVLLVGDSVGPVVLGYESTLPVTMEDMLHHTKAVTRAKTSAMVVGDMPFMSYQVSVEQAVRNAGRFVQEAGADAIKLEGGERVAPAVQRIVAAGIPVMGHLGLTPQSVNRLGGYRVQGRGADAESRLLEDAAFLAQAGCFALVLECVPATLAARVTAASPIPTIGIGAGPGCDGQVLVFHDLLGLLPGQPPKFVRRYADLGRLVTEAVAAYATDVRQRPVPGAEHSYGGGTGAAAAGAADSTGSESTGPAYPGGRSAGGEPAT